MAILAFRLMIEKNVRGLAVVDEVGYLVDNISDRDLRVCNIDVVDTVDDGVVTVL